MLVSNNHTGCYERLTHLTVGIILNTQVLILLLLVYKTVYLLPGLKKNVNWYSI